MDCDFKNKVILVTGSSSGIGFGIAEAFKKKGATIVLNSRHENTLIKAQEDLGGVCGIVADVTEPSQAKFLIEEVIRQFGQLDSLVCNVGSGRSVPPGMEDYDEWQRVFSTNLWSATNMVEVSKQHLEKVKGNIICISSICGSEVIPGAPTTYSVAKAALNGYVKSTSRALGKLGIRINAVSPGNILFEDSIWNKKIKENKEEVMSMLDKEVPIMQLGDIQDIGELCCYLSSSYAKFITGSVCVADGGQTR